MSTIDERILHMRFDNKDFEQNVGTTMSTLDKLKEKLNFTGSDSGINNLKRSINDFDLTNIQNGIDYLSGRFSALGIVGMQVLQRLTDAALNLGQKMISAVTTDSITDGFKEYELKMDSVQTILTGARNKNGTAVTLDQVNKKLNELNEYADQTIYSFSDMTTNIGKFTNAGVDLDTAVDAIQGISNVAALSGANATQASHAMYNFAQALSSGSVRLIDWKSIENANMATVDFKQTLIDTGLELGTLKKKGDNYISTTKDMNGKVSSAFNATKAFNDSLSSQWMTTDVLTAALAKYSDETTELGKKAFEAATQVKTFSQLVDTIKEALGSGWAQTFEYIIGDFEEARDLWTGVSNAISDVIDPIADARNEMFKFWHDNGGRDAMIETVRTLWNDLKNVSSIAKTIGSRVLEDTIGNIDGARLLEVTKTIKDFVTNLVPSEALVHLNASVLHTFFGVIETGIGIFKGGIEFVTRFWKAIEPGRELLYRTVTMLSNALSLVFTYIDRIGESFANNRGIEALANGFANIFNGLMKFIEPFGDFIFDFVAKFYDGNIFENIGSGLATIAKGFEAFTGSIDFGSAGSIAISVLSGIWSVISTIGSGIGAFVSGITSFVKAFLGFNENVSLAGSVIEWFKDKLDDLKASWNNEDSVFGRLHIWIDNTRDGLTKLRGSFAEFVKDKTIQAFTNLWSGITKAFELFVSGLKHLWDFAKQIFHSFFGDSLYTGVTRILTVLGAIDTVKFASNMASMSKNLSKMIESFSSIAGVGESLGKVGRTFVDNLIAPFKDLFNQGSTKTESLKELAIGIGILTTALIALSFVDFPKLQSGTIIIAELLASLAGFYAVLNKIPKSTSSGGKGGILSMLFGGSNESSTGNDLLKIAGSILILSGALAILSKINYEELIIGVLAISSILLALDLFIQDVSGLEPAAKGLVGVAIAVRVLVSSVKALADLDYTGLITGLVGLAAILVELGLFMYAMKDIESTSFGGILVLAVSLRVLVGVVKQLAELDLIGLVKGLVGVGAILLELGIFMNYMKDIESTTFGGMIVLAVALRILMASVKEMSEIDTYSLIQGLVGLAAILLSISTFMMEMDGVAAISIGAALGIVILSGAIKMLTGVISDLGAMDGYSLIKGLTGLAGALIAVAAAANLMSGVSPLFILTSVGLIALAAAVNLIVPPIKALSEIKFTSLIKSIGAMAAVLVIFGAAGTALGLVALPMMGASVAILAMAAAMAVLVIPIKTFSKMPLTELGKSLLALAGIFAVFGVAGAVLGPLSGFMLSAAGSILALSAAAAVAGGAMILASVGLTALSKAIRVVADTVLAILQSILGGLPVIGDSIDSWFEERRDALQSTFDSEESESAATEWVEGIGDGIVNGADKASDAATSLFGALSEQSEEAEEEAEEDGEGIGGALVDSLVGAITGGEDDAEEAGSGLSESLAGGIKDFDFKSITDNLADEALGNIGDHFIEQGNSIGDSFTESLTSSMENGNSGLESTGIDMADTFGDGFTSELEKYGLDMDSIMGDWDSTMETGMQAMEKTAKTGGTNAGKAYADGLGSNSVKQQIEYHAGCIPKFANDELKRANQDYYKSGWTSAAMVGKGIKDNTKASTASAKGISKAVNAEFKKTKTESYRLGQMTAEGFASGTKSKESHVKNIASGLARSALQSMKQALRSASPSKEARKIGEYGGLGFGLGFSDTTNYVRNKASDLANTGLSALQNSMTILKDSLNFSPDFEPVVSPVMDLSQIQNGMNSMNHMIGSPQFAVAGFGTVDPYALSTMRLLNSASETKEPVNTDVIFALKSVQDEVSTLRGAMESMQFVADGRQIGRIAYREVDRNLGTTVTRRRREGGR